MITIIKDEEQVLEITDDGFSVEGWLKITIRDKYKDISIDVHIKELLPALIGFHSKYSQETELQSVRNY